MSLPLGQGAVSPRCAACCVVNNGKQVHVCVGGGGGDSITGDLQPQPTKLRVFAEKMLPPTPSQSAQTRDIVNQPFRKTGFVYDFMHVQSITERF
jgi:hypothetical protein